MDPALRTRDPILSALRAATGQTHQQLEGAVDIGRRLHNPAAYRRLLEIFLGFYRPLERRLAGLRGWDVYRLDLSARRKTPWLEADLLALEPVAPGKNVPPDCMDLPRTDSLNRGFGCLYVLEGTTLGGRQITAMLQGSAVPAGARRFFASYGAETGTRWREFIRALEDHARTTDDAGRAEIVWGAQETFACLQGWFVRDCPAHEPHSQPPDAGPRRL